MKFGFLPFPEVQSTESTKEGENSGNAFTTSYRHVEKTEFVPHNEKGFLLFTKVQSGSQKVLRKGRKVRRNLNFFFFTVESTKENQSLFFILT